MATRGRKDADPARRKATGPAQAAQRSEPGARQLKTMAKALGNAQVQAVVARTDHQRDAIYQFILARLQRVQRVQSRERGAMSGHRVWFDEVARRKAGFALPDPTRWREVAVHYRHAAEALGRGNLGQAVQHLDRAMATEQQAMNALPEQVRLDQRDTAGAEAPDLQAPAGAGCTPREVSEAIALAESIERVSERAEAEGLPRARAPWWNREPEADDDADDKKKDGKKAERDAAGAVERPARETEQAPGVRQAEERTGEVQQAEERAEQHAVAHVTEPPARVRQVRTGVRRGKA